MKKYQLLIIIIVLVWMMAPACKKYLDVKSDKRLVVLKTLDDLQAMLNDYYTLNTRTPGLGVASSDGYFYTLKEFNSMYLLAKEKYIWDLKNYSKLDWYNAYRAVYMVNYCLDMIKKIKRTESNKEKWNEVKGAALFFRSFWYLKLAWVFSKAYDPKSARNDLGIVLRLSSDFTVPSKRASVEDSYERIIKDCKNAAKLLPDYPQKLTQPSRTAAYALLARTYLSMRKYDSAFKYSGMALKLNNNLLNFNNDSEVDINSNTPFKPLNKEIIFYSTQTTSFDVDEAFIDTVLYASYKTNDLRKQAYFRPNGRYFSLKATYNATSKYSFFSGLATDELFLIKAECEARNGKVQDGIRSLSKLLKNRYKAGTLSLPSSLSQQKAIDLILIERRKELFSRGTRWSDIKRLNLEGKNIVLTRKLGDKIYTLKPNSNYYALPLPADVIKLTGMPQNPR